MMSCVEIISFRVRVLLEKHTDRAAHSSQETLDKLRGLLDRFP